MIRFDVVPNSNNISVGCLCLSVCLSVVCMSLSSSVSLSVYLSVCLSICLSVYLSLSVYRSIYLSIYLSICFYLTGNMTEVFPVIILENYSIYIYIYRVSIPTITNPRSIICCIKHIGTTVALRFG